MVSNDDDRSKDQKPSKKKGGFFTFLFNPEKFVEEIQDEPNGVSDTTQIAQQTDQSVKTIPEAIPEELPEGLQGNTNGNGKNGHHPQPTHAAEPITNLPEQLVQPGAEVNDKFTSLHNMAETETAKKSDPLEANDLASEDGFSNYLNKFTYYDLLQLKSDVEQNAIHRQYLRRMRSILKIDSEERDLEPWQFQRLLLIINIAHQVLDDPITRKDYDQALSRNGAAGPSLKNAREQGRLIDIIELIRIFKILGPQTQALVTKALSERNGASDHELANKFVEEGLLSEEDLESVVLACYLLATGKINMSQLELVLSEIKESKSLLWVSLVAKGWVRMSDLS